MRLIRTLLLILTISACSSDRDNKSSSKFKVLHEYTTEEIRGLDSATLRIKRNEIFAQYGYIFKSNELAQYFKKMNWYEPKLTNVDSLLTELDKNNVEILLEEYQRIINKINCQNFDPKMRLRFHSSIPDIIDSLGLPDKSVIDEDRSCPVGQLHFWNFSSQGYSLMTLGDVYTKELDYHAGSRLYAINRMNDKASSIGIFNITLGDKLSVVQSKLDCIVRNNTNIEVSKSYGLSRVGEQLITEVSTIYILKLEEVWVRFAISQNNTLEFIMISSFNVSMAC